MAEFREQSGMLWEISPTDGPDELLGASIAYGLLDEPVAEYGALQIAAEHLRRELSRPLELPDGVYVPRDLLVSVVTDAPLTIAKRRRLVEQLVTAPMPYSDPMLGSAAAMAAAPRIHHPGLAPAAAALTAIAGLPDEVDPHRMRADTCEVGTIAYRDGGDGDGDGELYLVFENADNDPVRWNAPTGE